MGGAVSLACLHRIDLVVDIDLEETVEADLEGIMGAFIIRKANLVTMAFDLEDNSLVALHMEAFDQEETSTFNNPVDTTSTAQELDTFTVVVDTCQEVLKVAFIQEDIITYLDTLVEAYSLLGVVT